MAPNRQRSNVSCDDAYAFIDHNSYSSGILIISLRGAYRDSMAAQRGSSCYASSRAPALREAHMMTMLLPYLYAGWLRANCETSAEARPRDLEPPLTPRELEVLDWMQKGKSNGT